MANSPRLGLPLLQAAQAQKHVTVNEALVRLDGLCQLVLKSVDVTLPPAVAADGDCYGVPTGAVNEWAGREGEVALYANGGWIFATPGRGWRAWVEDVSAPAVFDGSAWAKGVVALSPKNAATSFEVVELDHVVTAGTTNAVAAAIPAHSIVFGVTGRVTTAITGTLTSWRLGVAGSDNRYGSGLGLGQGSWLRGLTGAPQAYYADTDLLLTGEGGDFADGGLRLSVHLMRLGLPGM